MLKLDGFYDGLVVGLVLGIVVGIPLGWFITQTFIAKTPATSEPTSYTNEEVWEWVDYKGRKRQITVHREVKPNA